MKEGRSGSDEGRENSRVQSEGSAERHRVWDDEGAGGIGASLLRIVTLLKRLLVSSLSSLRLTETLAGLETT